MKNIILTGDRPTGRLHLGHYVGSLKRRVEMQNSGEYDEINILIADDQALTDNADNPGKIRENIINVVLDYLSVGIDPTKSTICVQSALPALHALTFYYPVSYTHLDVYKRQENGVDSLIAEVVFGLRGKSVRLVNEQNAAHRALYHL